MAGRSVAQRFVDSYVCRGATRNSKTGTPGWAVMGSSQEKDLGVSTRFKVGSILVCLLTPSSFTVSCLTPRNLWPGFPPGDAPMDQCSSHQPRMACRRDGGEPTLSDQECDGGEEGPMHGGCLSSKAAIAFSWKERRWRDITEGKRQTPESGTRGRKTQQTAAGQRVPVGDHRIKDDQHGKSGVGERRRQIWNSAGGDLAGLRSTPWTEAVGLGAEKWGLKVGSEPPPLAAWKFEPVRLWQRHWMS